MRDRDHTKMPQGRDIPLLLLGMIGIGTSGPIIALSAMPILTLIFWRNLFGTFLMAPFALRHQDFKNPNFRRAALISIGAGTALALHFICFFLAMRYTTVAAGTALTALQPLFTAYFMVRLGGHIPSRAWIGMVISFIGVLIITGIDFQISTRAFIGDICAIACAALAALYMTLGAHAQRTLNTSTYATICYFVCSIEALAFALIKGDKVVGFAAKEWLLLVALTFGAQILGHTLFNLTLKRLSPAIVSLVIFFEAPISALLAFWWLGQLPPNGTIPGVLVLLFGCVIFVLRNRETESSVKAQ